MGDGWLGMNHEKRVVKPQQSRARMAALHETSPLQQHYWGFEMYKPALLPSSPTPSECKKAKEAEGGKDEGRGFGDK